MDTPEKNIRVRPSSSAKAANNAPPHFTSRGGPKEVLDPLLLAFRLQLMRKMHESGNVLKYLFDKEIVL